MFGLYAFSPFAFPPVFLLATMDPRDEDEDSSGDEDEDSSMDTSGEDEDSIMSLTLDPVNEAALRAFTGKLALSNDLTNELVAERYTYRKMLRYQMDFYLTRGGIIGRSGSRIIVDGLPSLRDQDAILIFNALCHLQSLYGPTDDDGVLGRDAFNGFDMTTFRQQYGASPIDRTRPLFRLWNEMGLKHTDLYVLQKVHNVTTIHGLKLLIMKINRENDRLRFVDDQVAPNVGHIIEWCSCNRVAFSEYTKARCYASYGEDNVFHIDDQARPVDPLVDSFVGGPWPPVNANAAAGVDGNAAAGVDAAVDE